MAADTRAGSVAAGAAAAAVGTGTRSGRSSLKAEALETGKLLAAGGIAGAVSKSATAPLARLTILYQASSSAIAEPNGGMQTTAIRPCLLLPPARLYPMQFRWLRLFRVKSRPSLPAAPASQCRLVQLTGTWTLDNGNIRVALCAQHMSEV